MHHYYNIKISDLHKKAKQHTGTIGGKLNFDSGGMHATKIESIPFIYSEAKKEFIFYGEFKAELTTTPCNYGGVRYWFLCPHCGDIKTVLLYDGNALACRRCLGTDHTSLNRTKTDFTYYFEQARKVAQKIDVSFEWNGWLGNANFPDKPKNMHHETYWQLWRKYVKYKEKGERLFMSRL